MSGDLWHPLPDWSPPSAAARQLLAALGLELDELLRRSGRSCRGCGDCCDFPRRGHVLFGARVELDLLLAWARENLGAGRGWSADEAARAIEQGRCPFWAGGRCLAHPVRLVGCRVYFCQAAGQAGPDGDLEAISALAHRRLAEVGRDAGGAWWYGPSLLYLRKNLVHQLNVDPET